MSDQGARVSRERTEPQIIVEGGLYNALLDKKGWLQSYVKGAEEAAKAGYEILKKNGTAVDAVEAAVRSMEEKEYFNAGRGSFVNQDGNVECDAMIMEGHSLDTGAVMAVRYFDHPVSLSRKILDDRQLGHCALSGEGALKYAREKGFPILDPKKLIVPGEEDRIKVVYYKDCVPPSVDSVTAVALDCKGNLACAMSTGGTPGKYKGRVGDVPLIGCGGYANKHGAVTACGHGESIIKTTLAKEVVNNIERGDNAMTAAESAIQKMKSANRGVEQFVGVIGIDEKGNIGIKTNVDHMPWACVKNGEVKSGSVPKDDFN
ncbi:isoaspartyl peptidase/L-asparaginase-like [Dendronephthya gigantea]|uniref:isoaspartyl peptidase/L-asparaginase-like n=1 Tax=Dendronephthya gigantea TaxID=151771 RepID=UPI00106C5F0A|nr:isoaspartyl peptidase/L-asparaginase-like [Dendronephthya gigantea]